MKILAIDTVTEACSVALSIDGECVSKVKIAANQHSAFILSMVDELLADHQLSLPQLDLIAVDNGPGSFTGIRIGIGVAQGLAYGADLPVIGINSLAALAAQVSSDGSVLSLIDARMKQVYWADYSKHPLSYTFNELMNIPLHLSAPGEVHCSQRQNQFEVVANGWQQYQEHVDQLVRAAVDLTTGVYPMAQEVAAIAALANEANQLIAAQLMPIYLRNDVASVSTKKKL